MSSFNHVSSSLVQSVSPTKIAAVLALTTSHSVSSSQSVMSNKPVTTSATNSTSHHTLNAGADNGECQLLGPFALFIQGALGLLALLSLVYKRWRERPQRPVKIWAFDASKQVVGSALLHVANLFMSMVSSGELKPKAGDFQANPCSFYLLNLAIDVSPWSSHVHSSHAKISLDYYRHSHPHRPPPPFHTCFLPHSFW